TVRSPDSVTATWKKSISFDVVICSASASFSPTGTAVASVLPLSRVRFSSGSSSGLKRRRGRHAGRARRPAGLLRHDPNQRPRNMVRVPFSRELRLSEGDAAGPLHPTPSPKRRGGARTSLPPTPPPGGLVFPPLRFGEGVGGGVSLFSPSPFRGGGWGVGFRRPVLHHLVCP